MIKPTVKHQLISELAEALYTLSHLVDKTPGEVAVRDGIMKLLRQVRDWPVEGE